MRHVRIITLVWIFHFICLLRNTGQYDKRPPCATVFFVSVGIADRYISFSDSTRLSPHLIAVGALWLALKFNTSDQRSASHWRYDISRLTEGALCITKEEILESERQVWVAVGHNVSWSGPIPYLMRINQDYSLSDDCQNRRVIKKTITRLAMTAVDLSFLREETETLVNAAYLSALGRKYQKKRVSAW